MVIAILLSLFLVSSAFAQTIQVTGTWVNPQSGPPASGARIERSIDNGATWVTACTVGPNDTTCTDSPQPIGQVYLYRVVRFDQFKDSPPSEVFTIAAVPPGAITNPTFSFTVTPGFVQTKVQWANTHNGQVRMDVKVDDGEWAQDCIVASDALECVGIQRPVGHVYNYRVVAIGEFGESPPSDVFSLITSGPDAPQGATWTYSQHP